MVLDVGKLSIILVLYFYSVNTSESPIELETTGVTHDQKKPIGETAELLCSAVSNISSDFIEWEKRNFTDDDTETTTISRGKVVLLSDSRISVQDDGSTVTIKISNLTENDSGLYKCLQPIDEDNYITSEVKLYVYSPLFFYDNSTSGVIITEEQKHVELNCFADGVPRPNIVWEHNSTASPDYIEQFEGNIVIFNSTTRDHTGTYTCKAENAVQSIERQVSLVVESQPIIRATKTQVQGFPNSDPVLECIVEAFPKPNISWFKDNTSLKYDERFEISQHADELSKTITTLKIFNSEKLNNGTYVCRATNKLGDTSTAVSYVFCNATPSGNIISSTTTISPPPSIESTDECAIKEDPETQNESGSPILKLIRKPFKLIKKLYRQAKSKFCQIKRKIKNKVQKVKDTLKKKMKTVSSSLLTSDTDNLNGQFKPDTNNLNGQFKPDTDNLNHTEHKVQFDN